MISIIITSYKEPKTIGRAIESILRNKPPNYEIIVVAPDNETLSVAKKFHKFKVIALKDEGKGKPAALNLAVSHAKGDILVLTDGDVYIDDNALFPLLIPLQDKRVGAVSGNPVSINSKDNALGFWAYVLTNVANDRRILAFKTKKRFFCSGYLFAIRKRIFPKLREDLLSEDGFISDSVYSNGFGIAYSPQSKVYIKYPTNFSDWIKQKKRSAGGYNQIRKLQGTEIRSFRSESSGAFGLIKYVSNIKEFFWLISLYFSRLYLWFVIYKDINLKNKKHKEIWQRVESTK